jgi:acyl-CoA thioesterase-2
VVARQAVGAILNLEASFHALEESADLQTVPMDASLPLPDTLASDAWSEAFDRRNIPRDVLTDDGRTGAGRAAAWFRVSSNPGQDQLLHRCWLAYMSDDMPFDSAREAHPDIRGREGATYNASLDHTIWFHRPLQAQEWHLYDFMTHGYTGNRGLSIGHVFALDGSHVATVAQEVLMREIRNPAD